MYQLITINASVFSIAFLLSWNFLQKGLFSEQDLSRARFNQGIFSFTFSFCVLMLLFFLEEVEQIFDTATSQWIWNVVFLVMDIILLIIIPLAVIKDLCCSTVPRQKRQRKNFIVSALACACFGIIFIVDAFIFKTYIEPKGSFMSSLFNPKGQDKSEMIDE